MSETKKAMVSVDFWDTLIDARSSGEKRNNIRHNALCEISKVHVRNLPETQIEAASKEASKNFNRIWFTEQRTPDAGELVSYILNILDISASKKEESYLIEQFEESLLKGPPALLEGAEDAINSLAGMYKMTLISDTMYSPGSVIRKFLQERELLDYFDAFLFSNEAGFSKPNPKAFYKMLDDTGCEAEESYHIGDRLNTDIAGAKSVGMKAILFTGISKKGHSADMEKDHQPDHICNSWSEIKKLLV